MTVAVFLWIFYHMVFFSSSTVHVNLYLWGWWHTVTIAKMGTAWLKNWFRSAVSTWYVCKHATVVYRPICITWISLSALDTYFSNQQNEMTPEWNPGALRSINTYAQYGLEAVHHRHCVYVQHGPHKSSPLLDWECPHMGEAVARQHAITFPCTHHSQVNSAFLSSELGVWFGL